MQVGPLEPFGPALLASNIVVPLERKQGVAASRLAGGGAVVAWSSGSDLVLQRLDAAGNPLGSVQTAGTLAPADFEVSTSFAITGTADGGWVVVWVSSAQTIQVRRYDASGAPTGDAALADPAVFAQVTMVQARALADGSFVIGWAAREGSTTAVSQVFLRRFTAAAAAAGDRTSVSSSAGEQSKLQFTPLPDGSLLAAWVQGNADGTAFNVVSRRFDVALNPLGSETTVGGQLFVSPPAAQAHVAVASLANGTSLIAWAQDSNVQWQLVGADGAPVGASGSAAVALSMIVETLEAVPAASGFSVVVEATFSSNRSSTGAITVLALDAAGTLSGRTELGQRTLWSVSPTTGAVCGPAAPGVAAAGGTDGRYLLAYETCGSGATLDVLAR